MNRQDNLTERIVCLCMVFFVVWRMPIVALYMNTYIAMAILTLLTMVLFFGTHIVRRFPRLFIAMVFYLILMVLDFVFSGGNVLNSVWSMFVELFPIFIGYILIRHKMNRAISVTVWMIILTYAITALTTYIGLLADPMASRLLATDTVDYTKYYRLNIGGFGFIYALALSHPVIIGFLLKKRHIVICACYSLLCGLCVIASAYTLAALLYLLSCVAYLFPLSTDANVRKKRMRLILIIAVLLIIALPTVFSVLAQWDVLETSANKLEDVANLLQGKDAEDADTQNRLMFYERSLNTFLQYPLFGGRMFKKSVGGHSFVLDTLGRWGLAGLAVVVYLYVTLGKYYAAVAKKTNGLYYGMLSFVMVIAMAVINPDTSTIILGITIPFTLYLFELNESKSASSAMTERRGTEPQ